MFLKNLDSKGAISIAKDKELSMEVVVESTRKLQVEKLLRDREISFTVSERPASPDLLSLRKRSPPTLKARFRMLPSRSGIDWKSFHPLNVIYAFMDELEKLFPSTCTVAVIGHTCEGRDIKMLKISNSGASNTGVWLDAATHAREWVTTCVVTYIADHIARNFETMPEWVTNKDWYFVPVVNPDGYIFSHTTDRLWRKSRARHRNTIVGVDLNRNFGYNWGRTGTESIECSSGDPNHNNYRGTESFSEPETCAVKDAILYSGSPFKIFMSFHAYSEVITFPWCYTNEPCPDYVSLLEGGTIMAKAIYETSGLMYKVGNFKDLMYNASGTSIDWSYAVARIPFSYLVELRSKHHKFLLPKNEIIDCCRESLSATLALAQFVDTKKCMNCTVLNKKNSK